MEQERPKFVDEIIKVIAKRGCADLCQMSVDIPSLPKSDELIPARDYLVDKGLIRITRDSKGGPRGYEHPLVSYEFNR